jgi:crotonobetainyl-CoA:carnitine CoA-transferase CaiB-like acyl-CoA transferase
MPSTVLRGIRVVDFGRYIAGPYCGALLAELGAEVIRVERTRGSEDRFIQPLAGGANGAQFLQCNRGKLGMTLDPRKPGAGEVVRRLVRSADVVVANLPPSGFAELGLDYETLVRQKPDIILTRITAYGVEGPYAERVGFDGIGQAMSGAMYLSGTPDAPSKCVANYVDFTTALAAALGTVAAIHERTKTGRGQIVDGSLLGSALALMNGTLVEQAVLAVDRAGTGNRSQLSGPSDTFRTKDGWVLVQTVGQPLFERWTRLVGERGLLDDARFSDDTVRGEHGVELSKRMQAWCSERTTDEVLGALAEAKIPAGPVYSPQAALDDPHVRAAKFLDNVEYPGVATPAPLARPPFRLSGSEAKSTPRAPTLGEHTERILAELGFSDEERAELRAQGVV